MVGDAAFVRRLPTTGEEEAALIRAASPNATSPVAGKLLQLPRALVAGSPLWGAGLPLLLPLPRFNHPERSSLGGFLGGVAEAAVAGRRCSFLGPWLEPPSPEGTPSH